MSIARQTRVFAPSAILLALLLGTPWFAGAQVPGGTITGHVQGPGSVSVPGATIILQDQQTGVRKMTWSDEAGNYTFSSIPAGTYKLQISLVGFRDDVREPVPVTEGKSLTVNIALVMALRDESATGTSQQSSKGNEGAPLNPASLPPGLRQRLDNAGDQIGAAAGDMLSGTENVRFAANAGGGAESLSQGDSGGGDAGPNSFDLQASASNSFLLSGSVARAATPGDEEEQRRRRFEDFRRAMQSEQAPGFGQGAGGEGRGGWGGFGGGFGGIMTGGGRGFRPPQINRIHGMLSARYSNSALDARPYPLNVAESPRIPAHSIQTGIGFGGPLNIPGVYKGGNKTNFFFNYNLERERQPFDNLATVPTEAERKGDFSQTVISAGSMAGTVPVLYDPQSNLSGPRTAFANNRIPSTRFSSAAVGLLDYIPLPNLPGAVQNFHLQESLPNSSDRVMGRIGHEISDHDNMGVFYFFNSSRSQGVSSFPLLTRNTSTRSQNLNWNETHTFNPHLVNNFLLNFNRQRISTLNPFAFQQDIAGDLGIQGVSGDPRDWGLPLINFTNFTGLNDLIPSLVRNQTFRTVDSVILSTGKHNLRFGGEVRRVQQNNLQNPDARGTFTFSGLTTSDLSTAGFPIAGTGFDFADFLLGLPQVTSVRFGTSSNYFRSWVYAFFIQDDWRMSPRLTFNLGLRYEYFQPMSEKYGHLSDFELSDGFSSAQVVTGLSSGSLPASLIRSDANNLSPRIGIAFRPWTQRRLVLRAGYGIFYDGSIYPRLVTNLANQPPFAEASTLQTTPLQVLTFEQGFPLIDPGIARNTYAVDPGFRTPYGQSWNFSLEDEIARDWIFSLGYVGTKGTKLDLLLGPNIAVAGSPLTTQDQLILKNAQQFTYETSGADSIYHGLQAGIRRQYHNGLSFSADYTFSKSIDNAASVGGAGRFVAQNFLDLQAERGLSVFDVRHRLTLRHSYELPFGDRKPFFNHGGLLGRALGDWRVSGNATLQSGTPYTARVLGNLTDNSGTGAYQAQRADATGLSVALPSSEQTALRFFNSSAFTLPQAGEFGNAGRNTIPGPGRINFDMSLSRGVTFSRERGIRADFRLEANNIFNTPSYTGLATVVNATDFGRVTSVGSMRSLTFSMRMRF
jgi:Carboxypeptidase regulatory-like domain